MSLGFQATALVGSPSCANAIAWSDENLLAVASGHLVTILVKKFCSFVNLGLNFNLLS